MTTTSDLMNKTGISCLRAGTAIELARVSIDEVTQNIDNVIEVMSDPTERTQWLEIRSTWANAQKQIALVLETIQGGEHG